MKITWLGHSSFRIDIADQVLLIDPWIDDNPKFPNEKRAEALEGATAIFLTHGHGDHASEALGIARERGIPICCGHELASLWSSEDGVETTGFGKGGTLDLGQVAVTMVHAVHSSSLDFTGDPTSYAGGECGFMVAGEGHTIYISGDTDVMADMAVFADLHTPDIGLLCCGGRFTMDIPRAAYACKKFFDFKVVIPSHYGTFPILAPSAEPLRDALPGVDVRLPDVMDPVEL